MPLEENARCVRVKANDQRDGLWKSTVAACTFPAGGLARSAKPCGGRDCGAGKLQLTHDSRLAAVRDAVTFHPILTQQGREHLRAGNYPLSLPVKQPFSP